MAAVQERDLYEVLGVSKDASQEEIRSAYLDLAKQYHPDKTGGDKAAEEKLKEISAAYHTLKNAEKRKQYDQEREARSAFAGFGNGGFAGGFQTFNFDDAGAFGVEDLFSSMFGGGTGMGARPAAHPGNDLDLPIEIDLLDVAEGARKSLRFKRWDRCAACAGTGAEPGTQRTACADCHGSGTVRHAQGPFRMSRTCPCCQGAGTVVETPCKACSGNGRVKVDRKIDVAIPKGVESGMRLRVAGEGEAGAPDGDLYVHIQVRKHPLFQRDGNNLTCEVPISFPQAALGAEILVPTLKGKAKLTVPAGTQSGAKLRMKGQGLPGLNGLGCGDQYVRVLVEVPKGLTKEQREIIERLRRIESA